VLFRVSECVSLQFAFLATRARWENDDEGGWGLGWLLADESGLGYELCGGANRGSVSARCEAWAIEVESCLMHRSRISLKKREAMTVDRVSVGKLKFAYVICVDRKVKYEKGRSRIVYIGTTKKGINRVSQSAATRFDAVFELKKVDRFMVYIITCTRRRHVKTWHQLERALLLVFKGMFGEIPTCNSHGKNYSWRGEEKLFAPSRLKAVLEDLS
jgi:hypothetical protein